MGVPTSEVGYTPAMPRREDYEVNKEHVVTLERESERETEKLFMNFLHFCDALIASIFLGTFGLIASRTLPTLL